MPGWPLAFSGRSEHRSDTRLSNALADQSYRPLPLNMPFSKLAMSLWKRATPDRLRCFSKHALPNKPGWQLAFSGRSEQHSNSNSRLSNALADQGFKQTTPDTSSLPAGSTEAAFTVHMLFPLLAKRSRRKAWSRPTLQQTEQLDQTDPLFSLAAVFEFQHPAGTERLSFGECLGNALGAAGSVQWTAGLVCTSDTACLRMLSKLAMPLCNHATPDRLRCFSTHAPSKQAGLTVDLFWSIGATL